MLIALVLCLLALTFAMEAKLALYLPQNSIGSEVQAAKALPSDARQTIQIGLQDQSPGFLLLPAMLLLALFTQFQPTTASQAYVTARDRSPMRVSTFLSPKTFFRPPPTL